jgi:glycosyltransferase involved in cell wall biosynthesis
MNKKISKIIDRYSYYLGKDTILIKDNKRLPKDVSIGIILDTAFTIPPKTGVCYRLYYLSRELMKNRIKVKLFLCNRNYRNDEEVKALSGEKHLEIHLIPEKIFYNPKSLLNILKSSKINAIQFEDSETAISLGLYLKDKLNIPLFLELHDDETALKRSIGGYRNSDIKLTNFVHYASGEIADLVVAMTERDMRSFIEIGISAAKLTLAPNGIDPTLFPYYGPNIKERNIIFIGNMFYPPNRQAAEIILKNILPKLKSYNFQATFIGMAPEELVNKYAKNPNVNFTGFINDINRELKRATLALCPVTAGSGMKVKILNFAAAGLPIISTTIGANGYEKLGSIILEDNFNKYHQIIQRLIREPNWAEKAGKQNRKDVIRYFSWNKVAKELSSKYRAYMAGYKYSSTMNGDVLAIDIPRPFWLAEKRVETNKNHNYYLIKKGMIKKEKL